MPDDVAQMSGNRRPNKRSPPKRAESQNATTSVRRLEPAFFFDFQQRLIASVGLWRVTSPALPLHPACFPNTWAPSSCRQHAANYSTPTLRHHNPRLS